jgi:hypothetical protein
MTPCLAPTVQHLFDAVYSPGGPYNQRFRHQIQSLCHAHAEQLRKGKKLYDATVLLNPRSLTNTSSFAAYTRHEADTYAANEDMMWLQLLQPFAELAAEQLKGICELHFDDLSRWLAVTWDENEEKNERVGSAQQGVPPNLTITDEAATFGNQTPNIAVAVSSGAFCQAIKGGVQVHKDLWIADAAESMISLLKHIGRMDSDLAFLANMGEMCEMAEMETNNATNARRTEPEPAPRPPYCSPPRLPVSSGAATYSAGNKRSHLPPPTAPDVPPGMLGRWDLCGKHNLKQLQALHGQFFKAIGYPWFLRQFMMRVFSTCTLVDNGEAGLKLTPVGKFMGYTLPEGRQFNEIPAIGFRHQVHHNTNPADSPITRLLTTSFSFLQNIAPKGPKWQLAGKPPTAASVQKLCYRFDNTHSTIFCSNDGSLLADMLYCNPRHYFASDAGVFDFRQMRRWVNHIRDVDETGLPRNMVSA